MGTWLGLAKPSGQQSFRMAALTNVRQADSKLYSRSRGEIPRLFLESDQAAMSYCQSIPLMEYAGFNGLFYDGQSLAYIHHNTKKGSDMHLLPPGNYAISNASLDTPWPKVLYSRQALSFINAQHSAEESAEILFEYLGNTEIADDASLPDTGVGLSLERMLSAAFIVSPEYGTRTSTAIIINSLKNDQNSQTALFVEHQFEPDGTQSRALSKRLT